MKDPLKKYVIAVTGDFGERCSHKALERWIESNGGIFAASINDHVTHLICTWDDWEKKTPKGKMEPTAEIPGAPDVSRHLHRVSIGEEDNAMEQHN